MLTVIFGLMLLLAFSGLKDFIVAVSIAFIALLVIAVLIFLWQIYLLLEKSSLGWSFNMISGFVHVVGWFSNPYFCKLFYWLCGISLIFCILKHRVDKLCNQKRL